MKDRKSEANYSQEERGNKEGANYSQEERGNKKGWTRRELLRRIIVGGAYFVLRGGAYFVLEKFTSACSPPPTPEAPIDQSKVYNFENFLEILKNNNLIDEEVYPFISESSRVPVLVKTPEGKSILTFSERSLEELIRDKEIRESIIRAYTDLKNGYQNLVILDIPTNLRNLLNLDFSEEVVVLLRLRIDENKYLLLPINFLKKEVLDRFLDESIIKNLPTIQIDEGASLRAIGQIVENNDLGFKIERTNIIDKSDLSGNKKPQNNTLIVFKKRSLPKETRWIRVLELRKDYPDLNSSSHWIFVYNERGKCIDVLTVPLSQFSDEIKNRLRFIEVHRALRHDLDHWISGINQNIIVRLIENEELIGEIFQHFSKNTTQPFKKIIEDLEIILELPDKEGISKGYFIRGFLKIETKGKGLKIYPVELYKLNNGRFYGFLNIGAVTSFTGLNIRISLLAQRWGLDISNISNKSLNALRGTFVFSNFFNRLKRLGVKPLGIVSNLKLPGILDILGAIETFRAARENIKKQLDAQSFLDTFPENVKKLIQEINIGFNLNFPNDWRIYTCFDPKELQKELNSFKVIVNPPLIISSDITRLGLGQIDNWYANSEDLGLFILKVKGMYYLAVYNPNNLDQDPPLRYIPLPSVDKIEEVFKFPLNDMDFRLTSKKQNTGLPIIDDILKLLTNVSGRLYFRIYAGILKNEDGSERILIFLVSENNKDIPVNLNEVKIEIK